MSNPIDDILANLEQKHSSTLVRLGNGAPLAPFPALPFDKEHSSYPLSLKSADINKKRGIVTSYLTVYCNPDGSPFVDPYNDIITPGSFTKTIQTLDAFRKSTNNQWLCPDLWQHDRSQPIGGIARLSEDSKGVIYECHLSMKLQRAQEALELIEQGVLGSSYGYDAKGHQMLPGNVRRLIEIALREVSQVTFPANPLATFIDVKDNRFTSYPTYPRRSMEEIPLSKLLSDMQSIGSRFQRKDNYTYTVPNSNTSVTLNVDGTITLNNVDHIDTDTGVALASMLYHLDALDDYSEAPDDTSLDTGANMYGEEADRRRLALKDAEWRAKKRLSFRPWDASR